MERSAASGEDIIRLSKLIAQIRNNPDNNPEEHLNRLKALLEDNTFSLNQGFEYWFYEKMDQLSDIFKSIPSKAYLSDIINGMIRKQAVVTKLLSQGISLDIINRVIHLINFNDESLSKTRATVYAYELIEKLSNVPKDEKKSNVPKDEEQKSNVPKDEKKSNVPKDQEENIVRRVINLIGQITDNPNNNPEEHLDRLKELLEDNTYSLKYSNYNLSIFRLRMGRLSDIFREIPSKAYLCDIIDGMIRKQIVVTELILKGINLDKINSVIHLIDFYDKRFSFERAILYALELITNSNSYDKSLQDKKMFYCTTPFNRSIATTKQRVDSCTLGGVKNSVNEKSYNGLQECVEVCHLEGSKQSKKSKKSISKKFYPKSASTCKKRHMRWNSKTKRCTKKR